MENSSNRRARRTTNCGRRSFIYSKHSSGVSGMQRSSTCCVQQSFGKICFVFGLLSPSFSRKRTLRLFPGTPFPPSSPPPGAFLFVDILASVALCAGLWVLASLCRGQDRSFPAPISDTLSLRNLFQLRHPLRTARRFVLPCVLDTRRPC